MRRDFGHTAAKATREASTAPVYLCAFERIGTGSQATVAAKPVALDPQANWSQPGS